MRLNKDIKLTLNDSKKTAFHKYNMQTESRINILQSGTKMKYDDWKF